MNSRRILVVVGMAALHTGCDQKLDPIQSPPPTPAPAPARSTTPCWERDIHPLFADRCLVCHGASQPYDFSSLDHVRLSLEGIRLKVRSDQMPPDDPLDSARKRILLQWVDSAGPRCAP